MKNIIKTACISLVLFGCLSQNIELKPVQKISGCLLKEISSVKGTKPDWTIESQLFTYDGNGNPLSWTILNEKGEIKWQVIIEYDNNRLKHLERHRYNTTRSNLELDSKKDFFINNDFTEILVRSYYKNGVGTLFTEDKPQKLYFKRGKQGVLKFNKSEYVEKDNFDKRVKDAAIYYYDNDNINILQKFLYDSNQLIKAKGFWKNVKNPFNTNIWLSLIADYNTEYGYGTDGGDWSENMQSIDPKSNIITTYETNTEGFPCRLTTKNPDFTPYPLEARYYYYNCDCK